MRSCSFSSSTWSLSVTASYLLGDERTGRALAFDPRRDVEACARAARERDPTHRLPVPGDVAGAMTAWEQADLPVEKE